MRSAEKNGTNLADGPDAVEVLVTETQDILAALRRALPELKRRWPIRSLAILGSVARGDARPDSDLDVLVEFGLPVGLTDFLALEHEIEVLVGRRVDLVSRPALKPYMGRNVLREAIPL
jgi:predicted nucleotidyltransferase